MSRGDRCMGRKNQARRSHLASLREGEAAFFHQVAHPFQAEESRMAFIHVTNGGRQGLQGPIAADAQQDLLLEAHFQVAAVQLIGDVAIISTVLLHIGIQEEERHSADAHAPYPGGHCATVVGHVDGHRAPHPRAGPG